MMRYRRFGRSEILVSEVGLGGGGIGQVWGETTPEEARAAIDRALAEGISFFDVAPAYGNGRAEAVLGEALRRRRENAIVATKVFLQLEELTDILGAMERSLAASLARLQMERIDVFQLHNPVTAKRGDRPGSLGLEDVLGPGGVVEGLHRLQETPAVRFIGFTGLGEARAVEDVMRNGGLDAVQVYVNLLNPSAVAPLPAHSSLHDHGQILPLAAELGLAAIGIRSHAAGALTGALDRPTAPDSLVGRDRERARRLGFLVHEGRTLAQVATRFVLDHPAICAVVPGAKNAAEVAEAVASVDLEPLSAEELRRLSEALQDDFGVREPIAALL